MRFRSSASLSAGVVHRLGGQHEACRGGALHERDEEARGQVLVAAERRFGVAQAGHQGERVVGVLEGKDAACGVGGRREKLVQHEGRLLAGRDKKSQEALAGFHVGPGQVLDGAGIADDHLGKPRRLQVAQDRVYARRA